MTKIFRDVSETNFVAFLAEIADLTLDGWAIDKSNPGDVSPFGLHYCATMYRDANTLEKLRQAAVGIDEKPKLTRAEILEQARAAKAAKAKLDVNTIQKEAA